MGFLNSMMVDDAVNVFANANDFAESVTYKPHGGSAITFNAPVTRHAPDEAAETGRRAYNVTVFVPNHATLGVTSVNTAGDKVNLPIAIGGTATDLSVVEILNQSPAGWTLLLR